MSAVLLYLGTPCFAQSPPINDNFTNRIVLPSGSVTFTGTLAHATLEEGESSGLVDPGGSNTQASGFSSSVWWSWTASASGPVTFEILNFSTNDIRNEGIDAWTGTNWPEDVAFVGGVRSHLGRHPFFSFPAIAGTIYQLRAIGTNYGDFTLRITETNVPIIVIQPADRTVLVNGSTYFSALAAGAPLDGPRFSYQWRFNGLDLPGETFPILSLDNLTTNQSGNYSVIVSNAVGGTISDVAVLKVTETISPPQLMFVGCSNGWYNFKILGDLGRLYRIESSTNLVNWSEEKSFPKDFIYPRSAYLVYFPPRERNGMVYNDTNFFSVPQSMQQKFYRTTSYVAPNEICINNLNKIRCAKDFWALEYRASLTSTPDMEELNPYIKNGVPFCPLDASKIPNNSYSIGGITINPYCKLSFGDHIHVLEAPEY